VALECGKVRRGDDGTIVTGRQGRRAARCGGASQGKRAMVRHSMSAGVLLTTIRRRRHLLDLSRTTSWSSSAAATSLERVPLGFMRDHASRRKSFPTALAVAWGDR
jgi:hypothetical protein